MSQRNESVELVELVLARMAVRYGVLWSRMWEDINPEALKADWVAELSGMPPYAVHYAMRFLPADRPPTVVAFKALCSRAPAPNQMRIHGPRQAPPPAIANWKPGFAADPLAGARSLRDREQCGDKALTMAQRDFWRTALRHEQPTEQSA